MTHLITELSKYLMILLIALYTYTCFSSLKRGLLPKQQNRRFRSQILYLYLFHANAYAVLYLSMQEAGAGPNMELLLFYLMQVVFFAIVLIIYHTAYRRASRLLVNNMCMLMAISFVMLTRLSYDFAMKQFQIAVMAMAVTLLIPVAISRFRFVRTLTWAYAIFGLLALYWSAPRKYTLSQDPPDHRQK
ncbi:hypothetical protein FACS1894111_10910 [Clostridia bacterium]|nr:hypothetical protein FACS1894111_10910 [Clostridia bacterium]